MKNLARLNALEKISGPKYETIRVFFVNKLPDGKNEFREQKSDGKEAIYTQEQYDQMQGPDTTIIEVNYVDKEPAETWLIDE